MPKQTIIITGFVGMNRSLAAHQLNPSEDGDARMYELMNVDPSELREVTPRPAWHLIPVESDEHGSDNKVWPRRVDTNGDYVTT